MKSLSSTSRRVARWFTSIPKNWFSAKPSRKHRRSWDLSAGVECLEDRQLLTGSYGAEILSNGDGVAADGVVINQNQPDDVNDPKVGVAADGSYVVAFGYQDTPTDSDIYFQRYGSDGARLGSHTIVARTGFNETNPGVAVAPDGRFVVVYQTNISGVESIRAQLYNADGSSRSSEIFVSNAVDDQTDPSVTIANNGDFVVTWQDDDQTDTDVIYRRYNADGTPKDADITLGAGDSTASYADPTIAVEPVSGDFVIVARKIFAAGNREIVYFRLADDGTIQQAETDVVGNNLNSYNLGNVAINDDSEFLITWLNSDSGAVLGRAFNSSGPLAGVVVLQNDTSSTSSRGLIAANDTDDTWIIAYQNNAEPGIDYQVRTTDLTSVQLDQTFQSSTRFTQVAVGANRTGDFAVVGRDFQPSRDVLRGFSRLENFDPNDSISEAIDIGTLSSGTVTAPGTPAISPNGGDVDFYSFTVSAGQTVTIETSQRDSDPVDTELRIFDAQGTRLAINDDISGFNRYSRIEMTFPNAGTFYAAVSHFQNDNFDPLTGANDTLGVSDPTGNYTLSFTVPPAPNTSVANNDNYTVGLNITQFREGPINPTSITVNDSVLANDTETTGKTAVIVQQPMFGTVNLNGDGTFTYTPSTSAGNDFWGFDTFTYEVQGGGAANSNTGTVTLMTHNAVLIQKLFNQFLGRGPDMSGFEQFTRTFNAGLNTLGELAGSMFTSDERLDPIVDDLYRTYLLRPVDPGGLATWKSEFRRTGGLSIVQAGIINSPEFFNAASATNPTLTPNAAYITELYRRLLGREPDPSGFQVQLGTLNAGFLDRAGIVFGFVDSLESRGNIVDGYFQTYFGRPATQQERDFNVNLLVTGTSRVQVQVLLIDSLEYFNNPLPPLLGTAIRTI